MRLSMLHLFFWKTQTVKNIPICRTDGIRFRRAESSKKVLIILKNRIIENKNVEKTP